MATLQKLGDEAECPINLAKMRIGRAQDNEIIIEDDAVSGHHAVITVENSNLKNQDKKYSIEDLQSTNNTFVNNKEISRQELKDGDIIRIGRIRLKFSTKEYVPPKQDLQKTQKLNKFIHGFLFS